LFDALHLFLNGINLSENRTGAGARVVGFEDDFRVVLNKMLLIEQKDRRFNIGNVDTMTSDEPVS
jgi:hypothetical protein